MRCFLLLYVFLVPCLFPQQVSISIVNSKYTKIKLYSISGERTTLLDSNITVKGSSIHFSLQKDAVNPGMLRLLLSPGAWIDFVNEGEDVSIKTDSKFLLDSMNVIISESNKLFYSFVKLNKAYKTKTELLQLILARYPKNDSYYGETKRRLNELHSEYTEFVNITSQENPGSFIAQYIRSAQLPVVDADIPIDKRLAYLKAHALDYVDFDNSRLVYSDVFANKTIEYLTYFSNPQLPKELLEKEFCASIDSILNRARVNSIVYEHVVEYLIDGFKRFGFDTVLDYIVNNYVIKDDLCLDIKTEGMIKRRIDQAKILKIGAQAPDFALNDINKKPVQLSKLNANRTILVFYSVQCPHCRDIMPKINSRYKEWKKNGIEVIGVCLETKREEWDKFVRENCPDIINVSDLNGWDGQMAKDYYLFATPTIFIFDNVRKIISKPMNIEEILIL